MLEKQCDGAGMNGDCGGWDSTAKVPIGVFSEEHTLGIKLQ